MAKLTHPHDKFLKALLDEPMALGALLRERLPPSLVPLLADEAHSADPVLRAGLLALKYATRETLQRAKLRKVLEAVAQAPRLLRRALVYMIETYRGVDRAQLLGEASRVLPKEDVITVAEELREEGRQEGRQEGRSVGLQEGAVGAQRAMLVRILSRRFGALSDDAQSKVMAAGSPELERWLDRALDATTLAAVFSATH